MTETKIVVQQLMDDLLEDLKPAGLSTMQTLYILEAVHRYAQGLVNECERTFQEQNRLRYG